VSVAGPAALAGLVAAVLAVAAAVRSLWSP